MWVTFTVWFCSPIPLLPEGFPYLFQCPEVRSAFSTITLLLSRLFMTPLSLSFCGSSAGKESVCNAGDLVLIPGWEDPLEKGTATHSGIPAWRISRTV